MNAMELFHQGGFIMYPLFIFSVLVWTVAVHKFFYLKSFAKESQKLGAEVERAISSNRLEDLKHIFRNSPSVITRPHEVLIEDVYTSKDELSDKLSRRLAETNSNLKKNLWILGTISSSADLTGLNQSSF